MRFFDYANDIWPYVLIGVVMLFAGAYLQNMGFEDRTHYTQLKTECEKHLPRDQHCIMQFIPDPDYSENVK